MNFLAHLLLDHATPEAMIGSLLPDLAPGPQRRSDHPAIQAAIDRHRRIDAFTDMHPLFARSKARLFPRHGRYSGILIDVFYDHLLSVSWETYHAQPLPRFIACGYESLGCRLAQMPPTMRLAVRRMIDQDWLGAYASDDGLRRILSMMSGRFSRRFGRRVELASAVEDLARHRAELASDFAGFFPDLLARMPAWREPAYGCGEGVSQCVHGA